MAGGFALPADLEREMALDHIGLVKRVCTHAIHITGLGSDLVRRGLALCPKMTTDVNEQNIGNWLRWFEQKLKLLSRRFEVVSSRWIVSSNSLEILKMMDWIPVVLVTFKVLVLGTGMFFAIKWHYDQGKKEKEKQKEMRAVLRAGGKAAAIFVLSLVGLVLVTFVLARKLGLDLPFP